MSCIGVFFALSPREVAAIEAFDSDEARLGYLKDEVEALFFDGRPDDMAEVDKSWDAMHRALANGLCDFEGGDYPLNHAVLSGKLLYANADNYIMSLKTPQQVKDIAAALARITEEVFRDRYDAINVEDYGPEFFGDDDFDYTWSYFQDVRNLYARAAQEGKAVLFTADQ